MELNICLLTDSYKLSHYKQYPPKTEKVYSYFESRVGAKYPYTIFFGLQYYLIKYLEGCVITPYKIEVAEEFAIKHMGKKDGVFNREGWEYIVKEHDGYLPISIKAVLEGTKVPTGNVLMTIENTDPKCWWLPNYLETLLVMVWYPSTVCTVSNSVRETIKKGLEQSGDLNGLPFKLHDFGFRGSTSVESAGIGGLAHLVNFSGSDTLEAIRVGMTYYNSDMCGFSIPASEHSTITSWGKENEVDAFRNMLKQYPDGLVACVSDSYDLENACKELWGNQLKDVIFSRNGTLVVRPDSGDIVKTVMSTLEWLFERFGGETNYKGFLKLHDKIRIIQGDGCTPETISKVISEMTLNGWSVDNIAFGMGGGLLQKLDRDTQRFAFKCSSVTIDGKEQDVYKEPKTDYTKNSKRGRLALVNDRVFGIKTVKESEIGERDNMLEEVFLNGQLLVEHSFEQIRNRSIL